MNRHKRYEMTERGKRTRLYNYESKASFIMGCKAQIGCKVCEIDEPVILCFHHPDNNKSFHVGCVSACRSWESIIEEIAKCEVLCMNHHILEHGWVEFIRGRVA